MAHGTLNIWVRNENCEVVDRRAHLHVYNCHGKQVFPTRWFDGGHIEVPVPPGCYIVTAGVVYGNVYTDKTMVVVGCGKDACINLVLNKFREEEAKKRDKPIIARGCAARIVTPLALNAMKAKIDPDDMQKAFDVIMKAANIDTRDMLEGINNEIREIKENLEVFRDTELNEVKEYLDSLYQLGKLIG